MASRYLASLCGYADEAYVKVCIMGNEEIISCKLHKCLQRFAFRASRIQLCFQLCDLIDDRCMERNICG